VPEVEPKIVYTPRPDATLETELNALSTVYKFVLSKSNASLKPSSPPHSPTAATTQRSLAMVSQPQTSVTPRAAKALHRLDEAGGGELPDARLTPTDRRFVRRLVTLAEQHLSDEGLMHLAGGAEVAAWRKRAREARER
jgi:hypothetical protein